MQYKQYCHDDDGNKVESRRSRKLDRSRIFAHNKAQHSNRKKDNGKA